MKIVKKLSWILSLFMTLALWAGDAPSVNTSAVLRERFVPSDEYVVPRLVAGGTLNLPAFDGETLSLTLGDRIAAGDGLSSFGATVNGQDVRDAVVVQLADGFIVTAKSPSTGFTLTFRLNLEGLTITERECSTGVHKCRTPKTLPKRLRDSMTAANVTRSPLTGDPLVDGKGILKGETHTNVVDILVGFDLSGSNWVATTSTFAGSTDPLRAFAADRVQNMNNALENSGLKDFFSFALAGVTVLEKDWGCADISGDAQSEKMDKYLDELTEGRAGVSVRAAREECCADIVTFLIESGEEGTVGLGYSLNDDTIRDSSFGDYAYNICSVAAAAVDHTMTHECGHNMGAGHAEMADKDNSGPQLYDYSTGYYFAVTGEVDVAHYFTIMGYNDDGYEHEDFDLYDEVPFFSSPNLTLMLDGVDTGVAVGDEKHDNTRLLSLTYPLVANYRVRKARLVLVAPDGGTVSGGTAAAAGQTVAIKATATAGMVFAGWFASYDEESGAYSDPVTLDGDIDYRTASGKWKMPEDADGEVMLYACFVATSEDEKISLANAGETISVNAETNFVLAVESLSLPKATVKGLPTGMKFDASTMTVSGTPTKPGVYEVQVSLMNASVKKAKVETFTIVVPNLVDDEIPVADAYGPFVPGATYTNTVEVAAGCTVSGLPTGFKWTAKDIIDNAKNVVIPANSFYGAATKPGSYTVYFTKTINGVKHTATATFTVSPMPILSVEMAGDTGGCKVTGVGAYLVGKKVSLKATAPKGTAFIGWTLDDMPWPNATDAAKASITYEMTTESLNIVATFEKEKMSVECEGLSSGTFISGVAGNADGIPLEIETQSGVKSVKVNKLPAGMKYDTKTGLITGAPTKAGTYLVELVVTANSGAEEKKTIEIVIAPAASGAVGTFNGFVSSDAVNVGTVQLTTTDTGKLTAKVIVASGTYSFSGVCWDSLESGIYSAMLETKKGETLKLCLDSNAGWNVNQLIGEFTAADETLVVSAQRNAFADKWLFKATENNEGGWTLAYTEDAKTADLTVMVKADGKTSIAGKLGTIKLSASGYVNVSTLGDGAMTVDFVSVVTVGKEKKALSITTNLWFDRSNDHEEGVGTAVIR